MEYYNPGSEQILTYTGKVFRYADPQVCVQDIAHALSNLCRWTGHVSDFYSIAQHCVLVSTQVPLRLALAGLMHDASEAYTGDVNKPLKTLLGPAFETIEDRIEAAINKRYGLENLTEGDHALVKKADLEIALAESKVLLNKEMVVRNVWPAKITIDPWPPNEAERAFIRRFNELI